MKVLFLLVCVIYLSGRDKQVAAYHPFFDPTPRLSTFRPRVVGGQNASPHQFPHQVSVQWAHKNSGGYQHVCGGSLISPTWVLCAGHCKTELPDGDYQIVAGLHNMAEHRHVQTRKVVKVVVHPEYKGGVNPNDVSLFQLESPIEFSNIIKPIKLPQQGANFNGDVQISGWGSISTSPFPNYPDILQTAVLPLLSYEDCANALVQLFGYSDPLDKASNICTGPLDGGKGACSGDSGGPLTKDGQVIGIVSWGVTPCGSRGAPSVYTRVSNFVDYIRSIVTDIPE